MPCRESPRGPIVRGGVSDNRPVAGAAANEESFGGRAAGEWVAGSLRGSVWKGARGGSGAKFSFKPSAKSGAAAAWSQIPAREAAGQQEARAAGAGQGGAAEPPLWTLLVLAASCFFRCRRPRAPLARMGVEAPGEPPAPGRRRRECRRVRLLCMLALTFLFFVVEVVVSRLTSSLAMLSDSFHMLSDVMALVVALVAVRFAQRTRATKKNTFGWVRAEVMGALVNAVFLTALCFTILLEAIERFTEPHEIQQPLVVIGVGVAGLLVNLLGLCLFHQHGAGHGHSHGGGGGGGGSRRSKAESAAGDLLKEETNTLVENCSSSNGLSLEKLGEILRGGVEEAETRR